ncbi:hypothetical protein [Streptomyces sp. DB-54]
MTWALDGSPQRDGTHTASRWRAAGSCVVQQLVVLHDGAGVGAWMDCDPSATTTAARTMATAVVDAAIPT